MNHKTSTNLWLQLFPESQESSTCRDMEAVCVVTKVETQLVEAENIISVGLCLIHTSLQARSADLPASPAGLLGRFAPSGFALRAPIPLARILRFALTKIFEKKRSVSINSKCSETRKNAKKKNFYPFWPITRFAHSAKFKKIFEKNKCVSIDSKCSETHRNAIKNFLPLWPNTRFARSAKPERRSATLPTPCHPQGPKECPCQVSCRLD